MRHRIKNSSMLQQECCDVGKGLNNTNAKLKHYNHLLHSDKSTSANGRWFINTLFLEARSRRPSLRGRAANPPRESGPSSKKVFTEPAKHTYFYKLSKTGKLGSSKLSCSHSMFSTIPLVLSSLVLLVVLGMMVACPDMEAEGLVPPGGPMSLVLEE